MTTYPEQRVCAACRSNDRLTTFSAFGQSVDFCQACVNRLRSGRCAATSGRNRCELPGGHDGDHLVGGIVSTLSWANQDDRIARGARAGTTEAA